MTTTRSPRQELGDFVESMELRACMEKHGRGLSDEAISLAVTVLSRYCAPRDRRFRRRTPRTPG